MLGPQAQSSSFWLTCFCCSCSPTKSVADALEFIWAVFFLKLKFLSNENSSFENCSFEWQVVHLCLLTNPARNALGSSEEARGQRWTQQKNASEPEVGGVQRMLGEHGGREWGHQAGLLGAQLWGPCLNVPEELNTDGEQGSLRLPSAWPHLPLSVIWTGSFPPYSLIWCTCYFRLTHFSVK